MMSFRNERLKRTALPGSTVWLLTDIAEAKGRHALYVRQAPEKLERMREVALIQSAESSSRIEGVIVDPARLGTLLIGSARPRDRSEEEVQGYRRALDHIHRDSRTLAVAGDEVRRLHRLVQEGSGDAGQWKLRDNEILQFPPDGGPPTVRFRPLSAAETPAAMEELCRRYTHAVDQERVPPLVAIAALVLDFLCVHPFRDGNGRVARLLTLLAMYHFDYEVGRYVSLERLVEESRAEYYDALYRSSQSWHDGTHDPLPWTNYLLVIVRRAYAEFAERAGPPA